MNNNNLYTLLNMYSEPTRLKILICLNKKTCCVSELVDFVETSQPNISKHLKILFVNNMVAKQKDGKNIIYSINPHFKKNCCLFEQLINIFEQHEDGIKTLNRMEK